MTRVDPDMPENFASLFAGVVRGRKEDDPPSDGEIVLYEVIDRLDPRFRDKTWTRNMNDLARIQTESDAEVIDMISFLRERGSQWNLAQASSYEQSLKFRQSLGEEWKEVLDDYKTGEKELYVDWGETMLSRGLEHPYINKEFIRSKGKEK